MTFEWISVAPVVLAANVADTPKTKKLPSLVIDEGHPFRQRMHNLR